MTHGIRGAEGGFATWYEYSDTPRVIDGMRITLENSSHLSRSVYIFDVPGSICRNRSGTARGSKPVENEGPTERGEETLELTAKLLRPHPFGNPLFNPAGNPALCCFPM